SSSLESSRVSSRSPLVFAASAVCSDAVQAVRRVLHRKEYDVAIRRSFAGMHDIGGNIDHRTGPGFDGLAADGGVEDALQNINPLFVWMRMRLRARSSRHAHQSDDHAI